MIEPTSERGRRLAAVSQQLRVLHDELVDQPADMRAEQIRDRVQRELSSLAPHDREPFVTDLMAMFPVWNAGAPATAPIAPRPVAAVASEPKDPAAIAEQLIAATAKLSSDAREAIASRLAAAGLVPMPAASSGASAPVREVVKEVVREVPTLAGMPEGAMAELKKMVGLPQDANVRADRMVELCTLLVEFTIKLEPWAVAYWQDIGKEAKNQVFRVLSKERPNERQGILARFVEGDASTDKDAVAKDILKLRSLVSLLLKGVLDAGKAFSRDHMTRFSVDAVQAGAEKGTFTESQAAKNWKQYVKLMEGFDAASMEKRIKGLIAKDVDAQLSQIIR
ncbi:MAG: hypothetical protein NTV94_19245 [Planctomycetota bacterium]|nr:hypothetical protein [Planctomycetota bacterium]